MDSVKTPQRQSEYNTDYSASVSVSVSESLSPNVQYTRQFYSHHNQYNTNDRSLSPIRRQRYNSGGGAASSRSISPVLVRSSRIENRMFDSVRRILNFSVSPSDRHLVTDPTNSELQTSCDPSMDITATFATSLSSPFSGDVVGNDSSSSSSSSSSSICSVCYDILPKEANRVYTVCGHLFCVKCILNWSEQQNSCPLCRRALIEFAADNHEDDHDDGESIYDGIPNLVDDPDPENIDNNNVVPELIDNNDHDDDDDHDHDDELIDNNFYDNIDNNRIITYINEFRYYENIYNTRVNPDNNVVDQPIARPMLDQYLYDDDGILWRGIAEEDDEIIPLSGMEIYHLNLSRNIARNAIRNYMHNLYLFSTFEFNGRIMHSFIRKSQYLQRPMHIIGRGNFYEFVLKATDTMSETNIFGFISNITLLGVENANRDFRHPTWGSTHEYSFTVEFFDPLWVITDNESSAYDEINRCFNIHHFIVKNIRFSEIRRLYHIWGVVNGEI